MSETGFKKKNKKNSTCFVSENNSPKKSAPVKKIKIKRDETMTFFLSFFFFFKLYNIYKSGSKCSVRKLVTYIFVDIFISIAHPVVEKKVPDNPISRHGALPAAGRLSEGGRDILLNGLPRGGGGGVGGRGGKKKGGIFFCLFCTAVWLLMWWGHTPWFKFIYHITAHTEEFSQWAAQ